MQSCPLLRAGYFTQEDPIGVAGGLNLYGYGEGDPVNNSDPFGLCPFSRAALGSLQCELWKASNGAAAALGAARDYVGSLVLTVRSGADAAGTQVELGGNGSAALVTSGAISPALGVSLSLESQVARVPAGAVEFTAAVPVGKLGPVTVSATTTVALSRGGQARRTRHGIDFAIKTPGGPPVVASMGETFRACTGRCPGDMR